VQSEHELLGQANDADDSFVVVDLLTSAVRKPTQGLQAELLDITIVPRDTAFGRLAEILSSGPGPAGRRLIKRLSRFPSSIDCLWRFWMGAQSA
jgi:hypothetical protein